MKRFCGKNQVLRVNKGNTRKGIIISVVIFAFVLFLFVYLIGKTAENSVQEQQKYLKEAIRQSLLQCYVTEGRYPENFSYLEEKYGLLYDKEHFRVDYRVYGSNLYPEIKVLVLEE